jgi:glucokinase
MQQPLVAGIDIGGTNIVYGLVTAEGKILAKGSMATALFPEIELLVKTVSEKIFQILANFPQHKLIGCGIGAPNGNFYTGNIEHAPNLVWKGIVPLASLFEKAIGVKSIITNDANAAALGEMLFGSAKGLSDFILITLGTGLGSGIVTGGKLLYGHDGFAGELGHVIVEPNGRQCGCGRIGCLETYCSATGLVKTYQEISKSGEQIDSVKIYERAKAGQPEAVQAFEITGDKLGLALANAVAFTSPEAFIFFGGLANAGDLLLKPLQVSFNRNLHIIYRNKVRLLLSSLNENDGAVLGAASLIWNEHA